MHKTLFSLLFVLSSFISRGDVLLNDTFSYPDGILQDVSTEKWAGHSGTTNQVDVSNGAVNLTGSETQDVNAALAGSPFLTTSGAILYASFKVTFAALPGKAGSYFAHFKNASATGFRCRIWSIKALDGQFNLGISSSGSSEPFALYPTALDLNIEYVVVVKLDVAMGQAMLWINPMVESDTHVQSDADTGITITSFAFRQSSGMGTMRIDDLVIATTFEEVVGQPPKLPTITHQPANVDIFVGDSAAFMAQAEGPEPLTYQWIFNDADIPNANDPTLILPAVSPANAGIYKVRISNNGGSVLSDGAALTVQIPAIPPDIARQPSSQMADIGDTVSFVVIVDGTEPLTYQWLFNDMELPGQTSSVLNLSDLTLAQSGAYKVKITNSAGSALSEAAILMVHEPEIAPNIIQQPQDTRVDLGSSAFFEVVASGTEPLVYQWLFNEVELPDEKDATLILPQVAITDGGAYKVRVSNEKGSLVSEVALLSIHIPPIPPTISKQPQATTAETGESISFTILAQGTEPLTYQWSENGQLLVGQTTAILSLRSVTTNDSGAYSVSVMNEAGTIFSEPAALRVNPPASPTPPTISFTNYLSHLVRPGDLEINTFTEHVLQPDETLRMEVAVRDPDGRELSLFASTNDLLPEAHWTILSNSTTTVTGAFEFSPTEKSAGNYFILRLEAHDDLTTNQMEWSFYVPTTQEQNLVITEFLANPDPSVLSPYFNPLHRLTPALNPEIDDQFVEIVNLSATAIDLTGWTLSDAVQVRHKFNPQFSLQSSNAAIVYGGPLDGFEPTLETQMTPASENISGLGFSGAEGDSVIIRNAAGQLISRVVYQTLPSRSSMTRYPDANGAFVPQESLGTNLFSPGKKWNGEPFALPLPPGNLAITRTEANEVHLTWQARIGQTYAILRASSASEPFAEIGGGLTFPAEQGEYTDVIDASATVFYILRSP